MLRHISAINHLTLIILLSTLFGCKSTISVDVQDPPVVTQNNTIDASALIIKSTTPALNDSGVDINNIIAVTFDKVVDPATVSEVTFSVLGVTGKVHTSDNLATFVPDKSLQPNTSYTAVVTTGIKDLSGNTISQQYTWTFTTVDVAQADTTSPAVLSSTPADNANDVAANSTLSVIFSEAMDPTTINSSSFSINGVSGSVTYSDMTATFSPSTPLTSSTSYTVVLTTGVKDLAGNSLKSDFSWSFTTQKILLTSNDTVAPTIVAVSPLTGSKNIGVNSAITAKFNETMDPATINNTTFSINGVSGTVSYKDFTATFTPDTALVSNTLYTATISTGVKDLAGNPMATPISWSFTTESLNTAPSISGNPPVNVAEGQIYTFSPTATDSDGDPLTFSIAGKPQWTTFDSVSGKLSGTPGFKDAGNYANVVISVSDGKETISLTPFTITVANVNQPPVISGSPPASAQTGQSYSFSPNASDPDGDSLTFSITNKPNWATFNNSNGTLTGTPGTQDIGNFANISISVSDGGATVSMAPFAVNIIDSNATACANFYLDSFQLTSGFDTQSPSTMSKPAKGVAYKDPAYGTCVVRATDHVTEDPHGGVRLRNDYSRRQAFNADNSLFIVYGSAGYWHLYDAHTLKYLRELPGFAGDAEPQWHPTDPNTLFWLPNSGGLVINKYNFTTNTSSVVTDFRHVTTIAGHSGSTSLLDVFPGAAHVWTKSEGSPSADARYWAFMVDGTDPNNPSCGGWCGLGVITYDMQTNTITGIYDLVAHGKGRPDHVSISPSGRWVVVSLTSGTYRLPRDLSAETLILGNTEHSDIASDKNGDDVFVFAHYANNLPTQYTGWVTAYDLDTSTYTPLWNIYVNGGSTSMHISGKAFKHPGWVLFSTYNLSNPDHLSRWYGYKIFAMELDTQKIVNIAHNYDGRIDYYTEVQASVSSDFTKILFNSNWATFDPTNFKMINGTTDVDAYFIEISAPN